jgi:hypothetical protein
MTTAAYAVVAEQQGSASLIWSHIGIGVILIIGLVIFGAVGGYLAAAQSGLKFIPVFKYVIGAAGAIIIVTIAPMQNVLNSLINGFKVEDIVSLIGLALTGGYAGSTLLEASAARFKTQIEKIEEKTDKIDGELQKSAIATEFAHKILTGQHLNTSEMQMFQRALTESTPSVRTMIAYLADENRRDTWQNQSKNFEPSKQIFQALLQTPEAKSNHWWYAWLGFCLKDQANPDYREAKQNLDRAIELRSTRGDDVKSGAYEFNRAYVSVKMDNLASANTALQEQINNDLDAASKFPRWRTIIDSDPTIQAWKTRYAAPRDKERQSYRSKESRKPRDKQEPKETRLYKPRSGNGTKPWQGNVQ